MDHILNFNKSVYSKESIITALNDFSEYLNGEISEHLDYYKIIIKINDGKESETNLIDEFNNYILAFNFN